MIREYRKFVARDGSKVYIPKLSVFGHPTRLSRKMFSKARSAQDYAERFRVRYRSLKEVSRGREIQT